MVEIPVEVAGKLYTGTMYTGTLIRDLMAVVERAEPSLERKRMADEDWPQTGDVPHRSQVSRRAIDIEKTTTTRSLTARNARETHMATRQSAFEKGKKPW